MKRPFWYGHQGGFTLVELIVSMAILLLLMLVLISITDATRRTWTYTTGKVEQFQDAREAFESITRKLGQATLNTYWGYHYPNGTSNPPDHYIRQSELRFISGQSSVLIPTSLNDENGSPLQTTTHAVFFQAPLGYVANQTYSNMENLLNTWGYFIEFGGDKYWWPGFVNNMATGQQPAQRFRFRVMELMEPSDSLSLYRYTSSNGSSYTAATWFTDPLGLSPRPVHVLAENIVALVLMPKLSVGDITGLNAAGGTYSDTSLVGTGAADNYLYDSTGTNMPLANLKDANLDPVNQLPPVVQVTMVAVDETSANRLQSLSGTTMPVLWQPGLFQDPSKYQADLDQLQANLLQHTFTDNGVPYAPNVTLRTALNYRIFTSTVSLKSSKWSRQQTN